MIRQAHTYLVGAMGGASLIAVAIAVFVVLVSAQVVKDWPLAGLGGGGEEAAVSEAQPAGPAAVPGSATGSAAAAAAGADVEKAARDGANRGGVNANGGAVAIDGGDRGAATDPGTTGGGTGQTGNPGGAPQTTNPGSSGGGGAASSGNGSGGGGKAPSGGGEAGGGGSAPSTSGQVTSTVNNTVNQVDETVLGGTLGKTGVTEVTESVVDGVAGPESVVGKVVDEAVGTVGGILGGGGKKP